MSLKVGTFLHSPEYNFPKLLYECFFFQMIERFLLSSDPSLSISFIFLYTIPFSWLLLISIPIHPPPLLLPDYIMALRKWTFRKVWLNTSQTTILPNFCPVSGAQTKCLEWSLAVTLSGIEVMSTTYVSSKAVCINICCSLSLHPTTLSTASSLLQPLYSYLFLFYHSGACFLSSLYWT